MFSISNIQEINDTFGREAGTKLIVRMANLIKTTIPSDYIFVRYMGPKFVIAFSGLELETTGEEVEKIKKKIECLTVEDKEQKKEIKPITNFILGTHYKGTGIEEVTKRLEEYLDNSGKDASGINCI